MSLGSNDDNLARINRSDKRWSFALTFIGLALGMAALIFAIEAIRLATTNAAYDDALCGTECAAWAEAGWQR